jgi:hypothetical protein
LVDILALSQNHVIDAIDPWGWLGKHSPKHIGRKRGGFDLLVVCTGDKSIYDAVFWACFVGFHYIDRDKQYA